MTIVERLIVNDKYGNLVSDEDVNASWTNVGATLPNGYGATINIGLAPLFVARNGRNDTNGLAIIPRGNSGFLWSTIASDGISKMQATFLTAEDIRIVPSHTYWRYMTHSLRCLVSTTNS